MSNKDNSTSINKKVFDSKKYFIYANLEALAGGTKRSGV